MKKDSALWRGTVTALQAVFAFLVGLIAVVWNVDGVPQAVVAYTQNNLPELLALFGLGTGLTSFLFNLIFRKNVPTK